MLDENKPHFSTTVEVIFRDIDALGHVNNAVYFTYMETARTKFFMESLKLKDANHLPLILASTSCTYHRPARFGDRLRIDVLVTRIGTKSFDLAYMMSIENDILIAEGDSVMVTYDYAKQSTVNIPPRMKALLLCHLLARN